MARIAASFGTDAFVGVKGPSLDRRVYGMLLRRRHSRVRQRSIRLLLSLAGVALYTGAAQTWVPVNATTAGFGYLLLVLVVASGWGFTEAVVTSVAATLVFNVFFLPPIGTLTIEDPQTPVIGGVHYARQSQILTVQVPPTIISGSTITVSDGIHGQIINNPTITAPTGGS